MTLLPFGYEQGHWMTVPVIRILDSDRRMLGIRKSRLFGCSLRMRELVDYTVGYSVNMVHLANTVTFRDSPSHAFACIACIRFYSCDGSYEDLASCAAL
jgi:hypothetical protein